MASAMLKIKVDGLVQQHASAMRILRYEYGVDIPSAQCIPTPPTTSEGVLDLLKKQSYRNSEDFKMDVVRAYLDTKWYKDDGLQGARLLDKLDELAKKDPKHRPIYAAIRDEFGLDPKNPHPRLVPPPPAPPGPKGTALRRAAEVAGPSSAPGPSSLSPPSPVAPPYVAEDAQSAEIAALRELVQLQAAKIDELAGRVARIEGRANGAHKQRAV